MSARRGARRPQGVLLESAEPDASRTRQLAYAVKFGRKVTFDVFDTDSVTGYIWGWDASSWFVVEIENDKMVKRLVTKALTSRITLHDESTYEGEPLRKEMEGFIRPFREAVLRDVFGRTQPAISRKAG